VSGLDQLFEQYHAVVWLTAGLALIIAEMLLLPGFFISFAASAFIMAGAVHLFALNVSLILEVTIFLLIGVGLFLPTRWLLKKQAQAVPDINQY
jgi:membrane protein implicated in regulation of membrane protease activity